MSNLKVVLVRHGKAEPSAPGVDDIDRHLTPEGKAALRSRLPQAFAMLDLPVRTEAWVSSAARAGETADLALRDVGVVGVTRSQLLYSQDVDEILKALSETDCECVIIFGHVPSLEHICARLCGLRIDFQPGAVCAIDVFEDARPHIMRAERPVGRLDWFAQGPVVD